MEYGTEVEPGAGSQLQVKKDGQSLSFDTGILQVSSAPGHRSSPPPPWFWFSHAKNPEAETTEK
jgi:hypothetical protein